jgi:hypothetical protein
MSIEDSPDTAHDEQELREAYIRALGLSLETASTALAELSTQELAEMAYERRACELGAPPLPADKSLPFGQESSSQDEH